MQAPQVPVSITMRQARRAYARLYKLATHPATVVDDETGQTLKITCSWRADAPGFRAWARAHGVWFSASHKHPIGKLARIMGGVS